mmetsp:Transcript_23670/g.51745  ORF Transcript_23670/g.51745 Transcript_23670/m.51745 type:complete len:213 (+) Transcript_23670:1304-1942(+)
MASALADKSFCRCFSSVISGLSESSFGVDADDDAAPFGGTLPLSMSISRPMLMLMFVLVASVASCDRMEENADPSVVWKDSAAAAAAENLPPVASGSDCAVFVFVFELVAVAVLVFDSAFAKSKIWSSTASRSLDSLTFRRFSSSLVARNCCIVHPISQHKSTRFLLKSLLLLTLMLLLLFALLVLGFFSCAELPGALLYRRGNQLLLLLVW